MRTPMILLAAAAALAASPAAAHPKLVSSTPAANASVAPTAKVELVFSERLVGNLSKAQVVMTGMPGMAKHAPMPIQGKSAVSADGKAITVIFARPLATGSYRVTYQVVSADTHKIQGSIDFRIR